MSRRRTRTRRRTRRARKDHTMLWIAAGGGLLWLAARASAASAQALPGAPAAGPAGDLGALWSSITGAISNVAQAAGKAFAPFVPTPQVASAPMPSGITNPAVGAALQQAFPPGAVYPGPG